MGRIGRHLRHLSLAQAQVEQIAARILVQDTAAKSLDQDAREAEIAQLGLERDVGRLQEELGRLARVVGLRRRGTAPRQLAGEHGHPLGWSGKHVKYALRREICLGA